MHPVGQVYPIDETYTDAAGLAKALTSPTYTVYVKGGNAVSAAMTNVALTSPSIGRAVGSVTPTVAAGFVLGTYYTIYMSATVALVGDIRRKVGEFRLLAAETTPGTVTVYDANAATAKDNTITLLSRVTDTRAAYLDATISSRSTLTAPQVRTELATELGRIDTTVSSRSTLTGAQAASAVRSDFTVELGRIDASVSSRSTLTALQAGSAVRTNLAAELAFLDIAVSSRASADSFTSGMTLLLNKSAVIQAQTDKLPAHPASTEDFETADWHRTVDGNRDAAYVAKINLSQLAGNKDVGDLDPITGTKDTTYYDQSGNVLLIIRRTYDMTRTPPDLIKVRTACHPIDATQMANLGG